MVGKTVVVLVTVGVVVVVVGTVVVVVVEVIEVVVGVDVGVVVVEIVVVVGIGGVVFGVAGFSVEQLVSTITRMRKIVKVLAFKLDIVHLIIMIVLFLGGESNK